MPMKRLLTVLLSLSIIGCASNCKYSVKGDSDIQMYNLQCAYTVKALTCKYESEGNYEAQAHYVQCLYTVTRF